MTTGSSAARSSRAWRPTLGSTTARLLVLFCIEVPATKATEVEFWTKRLQQRLDWLGPNANVIVTSSATPFRGAGIRYRVDG